MRSSLTDDQAQHAFSISGANEDGSMGDPDDRDT